MAKINLSQAEQNLQKTSSQYQLASASWDRIQSLPDVQSINIEKIEAEANKSVAEANMESARQALEQAKLMLAHTQINSPIQGVVTRVYFREGEYVRQGQPVAELIISDRLVLHALVDDYDAVWIKIEDIADLNTEVFPTSSFEGKVLRIHPSANENSKKFTVEIEIDNKLNKLRSGIFMHGSIEDKQIDEQPTMIIIPRECVVEQFGQYACFKLEYLEDDSLMAKRIFIDVLPVPGKPRFYQVTSGIDAGDKLVTKGIQHLGESTPVLMEN